MHLIYCASGLFFLALARTRPHTFICGFLLFSHRIVARLRKLRYDCSPLKSAAHHCLNHPVLYSSRRNDFVWQKCGICCLERQDFDRIGNNGKKIEVTEFFAQLPWKKTKKWYTRRDSNPRPSTPEADALSSWATGARILCCRLIYTIIQNFSSPVWNFFLCAIARITFRVYI